MQNKKALICVLLVILISGGLYVLLDNIDTPWWGSAIPGMLVAIAFISNWALGDKNKLVHKFLDSLTTALFKNETRATTVTISLFGVFVVVSILAWMTRPASSDYLAIHVVKSTPTGKKRIKNAEVVLYTETGARTHASGKTRADGIARFDDVDIPTVATIRIQITSNGVTKAWDPDPFTIQKLPGFKKFDLADVKP